MELESFRYDNAGEIEFKKHHEINPDLTFNSSFSSNITCKTIKENDFFTQISNTKDKKACFLKKKKGKKKSQNFINTINAEIESKPLVLKNIISLRDYSDTDRKYSYLQEGKHYRQGTKTKCWDAEQGGHPDRNVINIRPMFLSVLENVSRKETNLCLKYVEPVMFSNVITSHVTDPLQGPKFLDIIINKLQYVYHHNFSLEKLLVRKLEMIYKIYELNKTTLNDLLRIIEVNRKTRNNLQGHLIKIYPNKTEELRFDKTILKYTKTMLEHKEKYYVALKEDKKVCHQMFSLWSDIETVRTQSGRCTTSYILEIIKQEPSEEEADEIWMQLFEEEYSDLLIKAEYEFIVKYLRYKELKRTDKEKKNIIKPTLQFNTEEIKETAHSIVSSMVTKQKLDIHLKNNEKYFEKPLNQSSKKLYYFYKVYVDDVFVCESDRYLNARNAYLMDFTQTISIQILESNKNVKITLFENNVKIRSIRINISEITEDIDRAEYTRQRFMCDKIIAPSSKYIGSGYDIKTIAAANNVRLKSSNLFKGKLFTIYEAGVKLGWHEKTTSNGEKIRSLINLRTCLKRLLLGTTKPSLEVITEVVSNVYDKNIANDKEMINAVNEICREKVKSDNYVFVNNDYEQNSARLKLLYLRNIGRFLYLENKCIPLVNNQISTEQLSALTSTEDVNIKCLNFKDRDEMNPIDVQRYLGVHYVLRLNKNLMAKIDDFLSQKTYKDVVRDFEYLSARDLFSFKSSFNLGATSTVTKQQLLRNSLKNEQEIHIRVMRAHSLWNRAPGIDSEQNLNNDIAGIKMHPLRPFLRISYHSETHQTPTAVGCHPTWNYTVVIKSKLEPLSCININIYDECRTKVVESTSDQTYHYRRHTAWLGAVQIPMRAVLDAGTHRGAFKIMSPPFMFGYEISNEPKSTSDIVRLLRTDMAMVFLSITTSVAHLAAETYEQPLCNNDKNDLIIKHLNAFTSDYLYNFPTRNLSLTFVDSSGCNKIITEFLQPIPLPDDEWLPKNPKNESAKGSGQSRSSSSKSTRRKLPDRQAPSPLGRDNVDSWTKCENPSRFKAMDAAIRYVSLIPGYEVLEAHAITLMGVELLKVQYGSPLDHTILLASFFIHLGIKCYVIIGWGLPRGASSYVLVKFLNQRVATASEDVKKGFWVRNVGTAWYVYDAVAGERFDLREIGCPLKTVSHVFDCENIWVNMQSSQDCGSVSMDLTKTSDWQPVFNKPLFLTKPIDTSYSPPSDVEGLRDALETKIKNKIQKWRPHVKTVWNRYCSGLLRDALPHWERWAIATARPTPSPSHKLRQMMITYKMSGSPINMPYVNQKLITSRVKTTAVHMTEDPDVEFGLAVEVYAYPNNALSVWVYLVSIVKIND